MRWRSSGPGPSRLRNPYHRGSLRRLLVAFPTVLGRSSGNSLGTSLFLFCPFPIIRGTQINESCMQSRNDLIMHRTPSSFKNKKNMAPCHVGTVIEHQSVDHNPSSPRVPGYDQACPIISWCLVIMKIIQRHRGVHYCKNMGRFSLVVSYFLRWEDRVIDFLGGMK
jgi:hypothetical protein